MPIMVKSKELPTTRHLPTAEYCNRFSNFLLKILRRVAPNDDGILPSTCGCETNGYGCNYSRALLFLQRVDFKQVLRCGAAAVGTALAVQGAVHIRCVGTARAHFDCYCRRRSSIMRQRPAIMRQRPAQHRAPGSCYSQVNCTRGKVSRLELLVMLAVSCAWGSPSSTAVAFHVRQHHVMSAADSIGGGQQVLLDNTLLDSTVS